MSPGRRPTKSRAAGTRATKKRAPGKRARTKKPAAVETMALRAEPPAILAGGDVDVDRQRARDSGEEAVGGSVSTPDQDVVDELGRALGVEQEADDEVRTSAEILAERDRHRWTQEG